MCTQLLWLSWTKMTERWCFVFQHVDCSSKKQTSLGLTSLKAETLLKHKCLSLIFRHVNEIQIEDIFWGWKMYSCLQLWNGTCDRTRYMYTSDIMVLVYSCLPKLVPISWPTSRGALPMCLYFKVMVWASFKWFNLVAACISSLDKCAAYIFFYTFT